MNKLDEIYDKLGIHQGHKMPDTAGEFRKVLSSEIKTLFLELIGEDLDLPSRYTNNDGFWQAMGANREKRELRQKVEEL